MDAAAELGRNPVSKHHIQPEYGDEQADAGRDGTAEPVSRDQILRHERVQLITCRIGNLTRLIHALARFSLSMEMSRLTRDGTAEPVSRGQILRHARGQGSIHFPCSADHEQDWQPNPVDPYSAICDDHTYIHT